MGTDNLFQKRKKRNIRSLKRKKATIAPYDRVLIVCEGGKTEPNYFAEMRDLYRLSSANIVICGKECGSDPLSVVNYAIKRFKSDRGYDHVYCVIDRDKHATFDSAIDKLNQKRLGKGVTFKAIVSIPCFEIWLLLHFVYSTKKFIAPGSASNCELVLGELRKKGRLTDYAKGCTTIFSLTEKFLPEAIKNAKLLQQDNDKTGSENPSTNVHELVEYLAQIKTL